MFAAICGCADSSLRSHGLRSAKARITARLRFSRSKRLTANRLQELNSITIRGFRSFKITTPRLRPLNVPIGANGAGKSNLISFFRMLNELLSGRRFQPKRISPQCRRLLENAETYRFARIIMAVRATPASKSLAGRRCECGMVTQPMRARVTRGGVGRRGRSVRLLLLSCNSRSLGECKAQSTTDRDSGRFWRCPE